MSMGDCFRSQCYLCHAGFSMSHCFWVHATDWPSWFWNTGTKHDRSVSMPHTNIAMYPIILHNIICIYNISVWYKLWLSSQISKKSCIVLLMRADNPIRNMINAFSQKWPRSLKDLIASEVSWQFLSGLIRRFQITPADLLGLFFLSVQKKLLHISRTALKQ